MSPGVWDKRSSRRLSVCPLIRRADHHLSMMAHVESKERVGSWIKGAGGQLDQRCAQVITAF